MTAIATFFQLAAVVELLFAGATCAVETETFIPNGTVSHLRVTTDVEVFCFPVYVLVVNH